MDNAWGSDGRRRVPSAAALAARQRRMRVLQGCALLACALLLAMLLLARLM